MVELASEQSPTIVVATTLWQLLKDHYLLLPFLLIAIRFLYRRYASPLRNVPGPFLASGSRLWLVWSTYQGHTEHDHIELHKKYGPAVRISPWQVSLSSPAAAKEVLTAGKGYYKNDFYGVFPPPENPDIFTEVREDVHAQKKRVAAAAYSMNAMLKMSKFVEKTESQLFQIMGDYASSGKICDLGDYLHYFAFDVLGEMAFSKKFGFLDAGYDLEGAIRTIDDSQQYNGIVGQVPFMDYLLRRNPIRQMIPWTSTQHNLITRMAIKEIGERQKMGVDQVDERKDLLSQLIIGHKNSPDRFGKGDVFAVAHGAIFAGSDSTASTMQSFFYFVLKHPQVYKKILAELDKAKQDGLLSESIQYEESMKSLPYFQAALKEAMRLRPAVGLNITRHVPHGGVELDGRFYAEGTIVALNGWVLHRDKEIFGNDADVYRPERWLEGDSKSMDRYMFQFGGGAHLCIGKNLALLEINMAVPELLRKYHFELEDRNMTIKHRSTFFVVQSGLKVRVQKRT